ncbi:hypothetical protein [Paraburkholderia unamae]|uniref:Uncharacterized protein n=1 Tax=Paraburkholderia unamae TaxID=219649 RepID=A0ACC6RQG0_9BURK
MELSELAFEFFYCFSRFEFALKENGYLKSKVVGAKAEPSWDEFNVKWRGRYDVSEAAEQLLAAPPLRQVIGRNATLEWAAIPLDARTASLDKVTQVLRVVRNNLFHGGKHGARDWDNPERSMALLNLSLVVLDQLAELAVLGPDYERHY